MVKSLNKFVSLFNSGILQTKRRIQVENTSVNRSILNLLLNRGYVLNYEILNSQIIEVYQNFTYSQFKLLAFGKSSNTFVSCHKLKSFVNSGRTFVVATSEGYMFSDLALINGFGGAIIFEVKFILLTIWLL